MEKHKSNLEGSALKKACFSAKAKEDVAQKSGSRLEQLHSHEDTEDYLDGLETMYTGIKSTVVEGKSRLTAEQKEYYRTLINDYKAKFLSMGIKLMVGYKEIDAELKNDSYTLMTVPPENLVTSLATLDTQLSLYPSPVFLSLGQIKIVLTQGSQKQSHEVYQGSYESDGFYTRNTKRIVCPNLVNDREVFTFHHEMFHCLEYEYHGKSDNATWTSLVNKGGDLAQYGTVNVEEDQAMVGGSLWTYPMGLLELCKNNEILTKKVGLITGCDIDFTTMKFVDKPGQVGHYYRKWNKSFDAAFWNNLLARPVTQKMKLRMVNLWDGEDVKEAVSSLDVYSRKPVASNKPPVKAETSTTQNNTSVIASTKPKPHPLPTNLQAFREAMAAAKKRKASGGS